MAGLGCAGFLGLSALALAACGPQAAPDRAPEPGDRVVARVGPEAVYLSDVRRAAQAQGAIGEGEALDPASDLYRSVLDELIDRKLLAREAQRLHLDRDPAVARRLKALREKALADVLVSRAVDRRVTDEAVRELYAAQQKQPAARPLSLEAARPEIVRYLTFDEVRTLLARLRQETSVQVFPAPRSAAKPDPAGARP